MFNDKDIGCFIGNSITAHGMWMAEVYQTLRKNTGLNAIIAAFRA